MSEVFKIKIEEEVRVGKKTKTRLRVLGNGFDKRQEARQFIRNNRPLESWTSVWIIHPDGTEELA